MRKLIVQVTIVWLLLLSIRLVTIPTPLNILEQIGLIGVMIDYTMIKSRRLDDTGATTKT